MLSMFRKGLFFLCLAVISQLTTAAGPAECLVSPRVGESLEYKVNVKSLFHGANQTVRVVESGVYRDRPTLKIQCVLETVGLMKSLTGYRETEEVILDSEGLFPWVIQHEIRDKGDIEIEEVFFDYPNGTAIRLYSKNGGPEERTEISVPGYVQDGLSLQYFLRKNFTPGENEIYFYSNGKIKRINYQISEIREELTMECGTFNKYYRVDNPESKITILIADNPAHYPLVIRKNAKIGEVEAKLVVIN